MALQRGNAASAGIIGLILDHLLLAQVHVHQYYGGVFLVFFISVMIGVYDFT